MPLSKPDMGIVDKIIAYEDGQMTDEQVVGLFSDLVKNGMAWTLQGTYGRMASTLIDRGILDEHGNIDQETLDECLAS
jgi:hypothetical protein